VAYIKFCRNRGAAPLGDLNEYKVLDLFSGIGGFSLGLERAGPFRTVAFCERDRFCQAVLRKHWPGVPIYDDIKTIDYEGDCDIITGGYPCQPFSLASSQRKGTADDRHLWPFLFEVIKQKRPAWVICENVPGHITMGLDEVLFDLESEGYTSRPFVIGAVSVDAPHRRSRVFVISRAAKDVADTNGARLQRREEAGDAGSKRTRGDERAERCGDPERPAWPPEPDVGRVAARVPNRVDRLKALGNAVVPQVVEEIGKAILND